jgi:hypothetical protein
VGSLLQTQNLTLKAMGGGTKPLPHEPPQRRKRRASAIFPSRSLNPQTSVPVLLRLAGKTAKPSAIHKLGKKRKKNRKSGIMKTLVKLPQPRAVHCPTIGTAETLHPEAAGEALKVAKNVAVSPQPHPPAARTAMRPKPGIIFAVFNQPLYINRKMEYQ